MEPPQDTTTPASDVVTLPDEQAADDYNVADLERQAAEAMQPGIDAAFKTQDELEKDTPVEVPEKKEPPPADAPPPEPEPAASDTKVVARLATAQAQIERDRARLRRDRADLDKLLAQVEERVKKVEDHDAKRREFDEDPWAWVEANSDHPEKAYERMTYRLLGKEPKDKAGDSSQVPTRLKRLQSQMEGQLNAMREELKQEREARTEAERQRERQSILGFLATKVVEKTDNGEKPKWPICAHFGQESARRAYEEAEEAKREHREVQPANVIYDDLEKIYVRDLKELLNSSEHIRRSLGIEGWKQDDKTDNGQKPTETPQKRPAAEPRTLTNADATEKASNPETQVNDQYATFVSDENLLKEAAAAFREGNPHLWEES